MAEIEIRKLDKALLEERFNIFQYESLGHYKVDIQSLEDGWNIRLKKSQFPETFKKFDDKDKVIQPYKGDSEVFGAFVDGREAGLIQFEFLDFAKSMRVWDIDVWPEFQRIGVGTALMDKCKERAREQKARRLVLETQSSNLKAISFYRSQGFDLVGLDASHYHNDDVRRGEVRLEMAFYLD